MNNLGLPAHLITMIRDGTLEAEITAAYQDYDTLVTMLDTWEAENPSQVSQVPWCAAREAWKSAGRPRPEWYEVLYFFQNQTRPILKKMIGQELYRFEVGVNQRAMVERRKILATELPK